MHHVFFETAETYYPDGPVDVAGRAVAVAGRKDEAQKKRGRAPDVALHVEINHGRWIVRCPFCPSAQVASRTDRRFLCAECLNFAADGLWLPVLWPSARDQRDIEGALHGRPAAHVMNWTPDETVADLEAENAANGIA